MVTVEKKEEGSEGAVVPETEDIYPFEDDMDNVKKYDRSYTDIPEDDEPEPEKKEDKDKIWVASTSHRSYQNFIKSGIKIYDTWQIQYKKQAFKISVKNKEKALKIKGVIKIGDPKKNIGR